MCALQTSIVNEKNILSGLELKVCVFFSFLIYFFMFTRIVCECQLGNSICTASETHMELFKILKVIYSTTLVMFDNTTNIRVYIKLLNKLNFIVGTTLITG